MNKEIKEIIKELNVIEPKITYKGKSIIINSKKNNYVIKKKTNDIKTLHKYLTQRSFNYYPKCIYETDNYNVYEYLEKTNITREEAMLDIIKLLTLLHSKTVFYKEIDDNSYKELYENLLKRQEYLYNYYNDYADVIEKYEYMSPGDYLFIRNISIIYDSLNFSKDMLDKWYNILEEKKRIRLVNTHNDIRTEHYILNDNGSFLISWDKSKKDLPIYDLISFYNNEYKDSDFCDLFRNYEKHFPLTEEERYLLFAYLSLPKKIEYKSECELIKCNIVREFYDYLISSHKLANDYMMIKK